MKQALHTFFIFLLLPAFAFASSCDRIEDDIDEIQEEISELEEELEELERDADAEYQDLADNGSAQGLTLSQIRARQQIVTDEYYRDFYRINDEIDDLGKKLTEEKDDLYSCEKKANEEKQEERVESNDGDNIDRQVSSEETFKFNGEEYTRKELMPIVMRLLLLMLVMQSE